VEVDEEKRQEKKRSDGEYPEDLISHWWSSVATHEPAG